MRWSRITLQATCTDASHAEKGLPRYTIDLPLMSDGRIAMHELIANPQRALVAGELPEGGLVSGALDVKDKQCIFNWDEGPMDTLPPMRVFGASFRVGVTIALRPGAGPAELFQVVQCDYLPVGADGVAP